MKNKIVSLLQELQSNYLNVLTRCTASEINELNTIKLQVQEFYKKIKSLVIVRMDAIGDCLLFSNSIKQIRLLFPDAQITYICYSETREIMDRCPYIDVPIYLDRRELESSKAYRENIYIILQKHKFDLLINPLFSRELISEELVYLINAEIKIGVNGDDSNISSGLLGKLNNWYDFLLETEFVQNKFELDRNAEIITLLGGDASKLNLPELWTDEIDSNWKNDFLKKYQITEYAVVFPGTKGGKSSIKYWGAKNYAYIIDYIQHYLHLTVILLGGPDEEVICTEIMNFCQLQPIVLQGHFTLWKSVELLRDARFYLGSDTSLAHFTAALNVHCIVILGGGHFGRFFPYPNVFHHVKTVYKKLSCYNCNWKCSQPINRCISEISAKDVVNVLSNTITQTVNSKDGYRSSPLRKCNIVHKTGSAPVIDIILPPTNMHSWHLKEGWVFYLKNKGMLGRVFQVNQYQFDHFFNYLKSGSESDVIFAPGGDHHLHFLHDSLQKHDVWMKCSKIKMCYSYESTADTQYSFYQMYSQNARQVFTHFLVADENDLDLYLKDGLKAIWFPQFADVKFFYNYTPFKKRLNAVYFRGKLWGEYKERYKIISDLIKSKMIDVDDHFLQNTKLVENYNSYMAVINPPGVFGGFNVRTFEAMACGNLLFQFLPRNRPLNKNLFEHGKHLIYFESENIEFLKDEINTFKKNPDHYMSIARNGYNEVLENHTLEKRLNTMIEWITTDKKPDYPDHGKFSVSNTIPSDIIAENIVKSSSAGNIKVSAIISTFNSEKFIKGCLDDLLNQTLYQKGELEIIIVNSGSNQNEELIIEDYLRKNRNILYVKTRKEPLYKAWNRAIKLSSGKYLSNANTDDRHRRDSFEIMADFLDHQKEIGLVYADQIVTLHENETFEKYTRIGVLEWPEFDRIQLLHCACCGPQPMWRKSLHDKFGYFDEDLVVAGDYDWWLRISKNTKFKHLPEKLGLYLLAEDSIEHRHKFEMLNETSEIRSYYSREMGINFLDYIKYKDTFLEIDEQFTAEVDFEAAENNEMLTKAENLIESNELEKAKNILGIILKKNNFNKFAMNNLALIEILDQKYNSALNLLEKILKEDPEDETALNNLNYLDELFNTPNDSG